MRNFYFILGVFVSTLAYAQPQAFKYQAVVRDAGGEVLVSQNVGFQISILKDDVNGDVIYVEEHAATTSSYGSVTLEIGRGNNSTSDFSVIEWGATSYFIQIAWDLTGGTNYEVAGTSELLSVPYALYAGQVQRVENTLAYNVMDERFCSSEYNYNLSLEIPGVELADLLSFSVVQKIFINGEFSRAFKLDLTWANQLVINPYYSWGGELTALKVGDQFKAEVFIRGIKEDYKLVVEETVSVDACAPVAEICDNGIDDDGDGFTDDEDDDCIVSVLANLSIVEVYYDSPGADEVEWVKIYNNENVAVDLSDYSFGSGGSDYTYYKTQLSGTIQPQSCFVFGKGAGDSLNYDLEISTISIQNGGVEADGVALFYGLSSSVKATSVPINAVLFGTANSNGNNLLGADGNPAEVLAPDVTQGSSIYYNSTGGWIENTTPNSSECMRQ